MNETILKIEECQFNHQILRERLGTKPEYTDYVTLDYSYEGFVITTSKQEIKLGISDGQRCCERWGYFLTNDNPEDFIGANVLSVDIVDEILDKKKDVEIYEGSVIFVNIETDRGTLQFTAYNEHNGYYGHDAIVVANGKDIVQCL